VLSDPIVHIVNDSPGARQTLCRLLGAAGLSSVEYDSGNVFLATSHTIAVGCVLIEVRMPGMNGIELLSRLRARGFAVPIIMLSADADVPTVVRAMKSGATDFIERPFEEAVLLDAIRRAIAAGDETKDEQEHEDARLRVNALTPRERQVLYGIVHGHSSKVIAFDLGLSVRTIEVHRARMMDRLGLRHTAEAVRLAVLARFDK
jgi:two-component system, LuxR family, response regulator FixJ